MAINTTNRYIWLINHLLLRGPQTFIQISQRWQESGLGDGKPLPLRTFHQHQKAIEKIFGVQIVCNPRDGYRYSLEGREMLQENRTRRWLLNSLTLSNIITTAHNMNGRILFEEIPCGNEHLATIIGAMQESTGLVVDYQAFGHHRANYHLHPYAMKVYERRWYVLGYLVEQQELRHLALDRMIAVEEDGYHFTLPDDFDAERYYANVVGIFVDPAEEPTTVRLRAYGEMVDYLRTLPLHATQREVKSRHGQYSEFEYRLCPTAELTSRLLSMGDRVQVLEPPQLRQELLSRLQSAIGRYQDQEESPPPYL